MEITQYAPVLIITLNRHIHFKRCVESLSRCTHAEKTDLFIALDHPLNDSHWEGYEIIKEYVKHINDFKTVTIIKREVNFGPRKNSAEARKLIFEKYDRIILSEDDNEFALSFLDFVNKGLEVYKDREDIFAVTGYCYPINASSLSKKKAFLWQGFAAWGVGIWKGKWEQINWDKEVIMSNMNNFLCNPREVYKHHKVANHLVGNKLSMVKKNVVHGDSYLSWYLIKNNLYVVFPAVSHVRNTGHDGSGINCGFMEHNPYKEQKIYDGEMSCSLNKNIQPDPLIARSIYNHFKIPFKSKVKLFIRLLMFYISTKLILFQKKQS